MQSKFNKIKILSFYLFALMLIFIGKTNVLADTCSKYGSGYRYIIDVTKGVPKSISLDSILSTCSIEHTKVYDYKSSNGNYITNKALSDSVVINNDNVSFGSGESATVRYSKGGVTQSTNILFYFGKVGSICSSNSNNIINIDSSVVTATSINVNSRVSSCTKISPSNMEYTLNNNSQKGIDIDKFGYMSVDVSEISNDSTVNVNVKFEHNGVKYNLTLPYHFKIKGAILKTYLNDISPSIKNGDVIVPQRNIKDSARRALAEKLGKDINISDITWDYFGKATTSSFVENLSNGSYKVSKSRVEKLTTDSSVTIEVKLKYKKTTYTFNYVIKYVKSSNGGNNSNTDNNTGNNGSGSSTSETAKCYYNKSMETYSFIVPSKATGGNYELYKDANGNEVTTKETCATLNKAPENTTDGTLDTSTDSGSTDSGTSGKNACTTFKVARERAYNCNTSAGGACSELDKLGLRKDDSYFNPVISGISNYYYVYKAYYNCDGFDSTMAITSFCIDPGLKGPKIKKDGYNNYTGTTEEIDTNTEFYKGLYRLYTAWYREKYDYIAGKYAGPNSKDDFVDFIMDNVSRKLRLKYDETKADYLATGKKTLVNEFNYYKSNPLGSGANNSVGNALVKEIWNDVVNFIENGSINTSNSASYTMPIAHYDYIVGDFDGKESTPGYYCGLYADGNNTPHRNADGTIYKGHFGNSNYKHNGIDFVAAKGTKVYAATSGTIVQVFNYSKNCYGKSDCKNSNNKVGMGYKVLNDDGTYSLYMHMSKLYKTKNSRVSLGEEIGEVGDTGEAQAAHLHYEMRKAPGTKGNAINARAYLPMDDVETCAIDPWTKNDSTSSTTTTSSSSANIKFSADTTASPTKTNSSKGFEVTVKFSVTGNNESILNGIKQDETNAIFVKTDKDEVISNDSLKIEKVEDWTSIEGGYAITYKVSCDNVYNYITNKDFNSVLVGLKISYVDPRSVSNILILGTEETNGTAKHLQDFVTFLNGTVDKVTNVAIPFESETKNVCRPSFSMPCTNQENVNYLIEGTQSGALYNTLMNGLKNVGDLQNLLSGAYDMLTQLKNINLESLGKNDLKIITGILENFVDSGAVLKTISKELGGYLTPLANNGNKTARALLNAINSVSFSTDAKTNFQNLTAVFINTLMTVLPNGVDNVSKEWDEILNAMKTGVDNNTVSDTLYSLMENLGTAIKNSGSSLGNILKGAESISNYFKNNENFKNVTDIESALKALEATLQSIVVDGTQKLGSIMDTVKNTFSSLNPTKLLTSPENWNIFETISNALIVDWEKCIIGEDGVEATDPNGNSYTIQESNDDGYGMFCTITCKEDYAVKMPGNLGTTYAGRYISTNLDNVYHATVGIAGQRTCVTTEIKNDKYIESASAAKDEMLEAYNNFYDSYMKYKALKSRENSDKRSLDAYPQPIKDPLNIEEVKSKLMSGLEDAVRNTFDQFISSILPNEDAEAAKNKFANSSASLISNLAMMAISGDLNAENLEKTFTGFIQTELSDYQERIEGAFKNVLPNLLNNCTEVAKSVLGNTAGNAIGLVGKKALEYTCNQVADALMDVYGIGAVIKGICGTYTAVTTGFEQVIIATNKASGHKIFQIELGVDYSYTYHKYIYSDSSSKEKVLSSNFVEGNDGDSLVSGNETSTGNETTIWVMNNNGQFEIHDLKYGSVIVRSFSQVEKIAEDVKKLGNLSILQTGDFENQLKGLIDTAQNLSSSFTFSELKKTSDFLSGGNFSGITDMISNIMNIFTDLTGATDNVLTGVTDAVDTALLIYYDFLGIFNPYYASLGDLRHSMEDYKDAYYSAQENLIDLANRMNACTMWSNSYEFNPTIEFTYGLSGYFVNKKDTTTEKISLKAINKGEAENVSYYCDGDVAINDVQNWDVLTSGQCRTDDGMIGGLLTGLLGDDNALNQTLQVFKDNSPGLKKILNNSKVKEAINNSGYASKIDELLRAGFGNDFGDIFGGDDSDNLVTVVPGNIVYKAILSDGSTDSSTGIQSFKGLFDVIGSGGFSFDNVLNSINNSITYSTGTNTEIKYRDVGRVINISRYGNPGVSISGLSWQSILSNIATYISSKTGSDVMSRLNNSAMSAFGMGSQEFIYYESSKQYWTSSNKGIYTNSPTASDSVLVDTGDPALTDDKIKSGTDAEKKADGLIYPIALSTKEGKYKYQIKINNVGQYYNNRTATGRIIDDTGYVNGLLANQYVCNYEVKAEPETPNSDCEAILNSTDCQKENEDGTKKSYLDLFMGTSKDNKLYEEYENKANACINKLLADGNACCNIIDKRKVPSSNETYNKVCKTNSNGTPCSGIKLYGEDSALQTTITTKNSSALIGNNGTLQFYTKVVSNYDLFPNGGKSKGYNWSGKTSGYENKSDDGTPGKQDLSSIIEKIEDVGDGIYADNEKYLEYSITMNSACMNAIKTYNKNQEIIDLGFGDYSASSISKESREYKSQFLADIQSNSEYSSCKIDSYLK